MIASPRPERDISSIRRQDDALAIAIHEGATPSIRGVGSEPSVPEAPTRNTEIRHFYLTFDTPLPEANTTIHLGGEAQTAANPAATPPPEPDLTPFTNPLHWPRHRKNLLLALSCIATFLTAYTAGAYSPVSHVMASALGGGGYPAPHLGVVAGITTFCTGFALAPMVLAPLSEINGRYPVFAAAGLVFVASQGGCAAATTLPGMLASRFATGVGGSVFSTMVGGVIADLWDAAGRNTPMALFSGAVLVGTGAGPLVGAVFAGEAVAEAGTWRWVFWHQAIADAVLMVALVVLFRESRGSVLLSRKGRALNRWYEELEGAGYFGVWMEEDATRWNEDTDSSGSSEPEEAVDDDDHRGPRWVYPAAGVEGVSDEEKKVESSRRNSSVSGLTLQRIRWRVKSDEERSSVGKMISISVYRPFHLLLTEPVVFFFSLWVAFAWAVLYLTFGCIPLVFTTVYGWNTEQSGRIFIAMIVGSVLATTMGLLQEQLLRHPGWDPDSGVDPATLPHASVWLFLRRRLPSNVPESRLYFTCMTATLLPIGLFVFGLSARGDSHWMGPAVAIALATMGIFAIYLATFNYLADVYHTYASSALAAQSFCRNVLGGVFPLVTGALFRNLGPANAGVLLGCIATALTLVPWVLVLYGEKIRARSRFAVALDKV